MGGVVSEAEFIYLGFVKEKWTGMSVERVFAMLSDPASEMDDHLAHEKFHEVFWKYHDWYWAEQRSKL